MARGIARALVALALLACEAPAPPPSDLAGPWMGELTSPSRAGTSFDLLLEQRGAVLSGRFALGAAVGDVAGHVDGAAARLTLQLSSSGCAGAWSADARLDGAALALDTRGGDCGALLENARGRLTRHGPGSVSGTAIDLHATPSGDVAVPRDVTTTAELLVPDGAGGFERRAVRGSALGIWRVDDVPAVPVLVRIGGAYFESASRVVDLGAARFGRPDVVGAAAGTELDLALTGLEGWQEGDALELVCAATGTVASMFEVAPMAHAAPAALSLSWEGEALVDGARGDRVTIAHLAARTSDDGFPYLAAAGLAPVDAFTLVDGARGSVAARFQATPSTVEASFELGGGAFDNLRSAVGPTAQIYARALLVAALPGADARGVYQGAPSLALVDFGVGGSDVSSGVVSFADPYPSDWPIFAQAQVRYTDLRLVPGAAAPVRVFAASTHTDRIEALVDGPIVPAVGPVRALRVDGRAANVDVLGTGLTPVVEWTAPAYGTAHFYVVTVTKVDPFAAPGRRREVVATLYTRGLRVQLPPGVLATSQAFVITVASRFSPGVDIDARPLRRALPSSSVERLSAIVVP